MNSIRFSQSPRSDRFQLSLSCHFHLSQTDRCRRTISLLDKYHADLLSACETEEFEEHLAYCSECCRQADSYLAVIQIAASLPEKQPSIEAEERFFRMVAAATNHENAALEPFDESQLDFPIPTS